MLRATGISHGYGAEPLFRDVNLTIGAGERVGLVGPNGTGKSTLLRVLARIEKPDRGYVEHAPGTRIGWYAQQVPDPDATVGAFLAAAPGELADLERELRAVEPALAGAGPAAVARHAALVERFGMLGGWSYRARIDGVLDRLDVADLAPERRLGSLSGGQQARLMLARVLLAEPNLLILDEPTNHLDAAGIAWLGRYLAGFPGAVLVVSHDRAFLDDAVRRVVELDGIHPEPQDYPGGGYSAYRLEKRRRWERLLLGYEAQEKQRRRLEQDIERTREQALGVELSTRNDRLRRYAKKVARKAKARQRRLETQMRRAAWIAEPRTRPPLTLAFDGPAEDTGAVAVNRLGVEVAGRCLLRDVDLRLRPGERLLVTGANGAGKSTLLAVLAGRLAPAAGTVDVAGGAALLPQVHDALPADRTVLGYFRSQVPVYEEDAEALLAAHLFDEDTWHRPLGRLSAGELRRLVLATLVNRRAGALLLDEPTNFLDFDALEVLEEALAGYRGTLVAVTHDRYLARALRPDRVVDVAGGTLRDGS